MILIGENIHIISKTVREALENKDENFVKKMIKFQQNVDAIDLNVGFAKGKLDKIFEWLVPLCGDKNISFDSSNIDAISKGLGLVSSPKNCFINSTTNDDETIERLSNLALKYNCNLIALTMSKSKGIPASADERVEIAFEMYEKLTAKGMSGDKIFFDPLILPVKTAQNQAVETLNTIRMLRESFEDVNIIVGLSNISNGMPKELKPLVNRVFLTLAYGAGLNSVILNAQDDKLINIIKMLEQNSATSETEHLYINIVNMMKNFSEPEDVVFDKNSSEAQNIIKTVNILMNKNVYSDSFTQI